MEYQKSFMKGQMKDKLVKKEERKTFLIRSLLCKNQLSCNQARGSWRSKEM